MEGLSPDKQRSAGIMMEIPVTKSLLETPRLPIRLKKRLSTESKSPPSVEEIEAKLRHADLRRQQYYEKLSSKARPKPRSPSRSSSSEEDLGQRLEAKLQAAEQKRLSILAKAQMRLAHLDKLRQSARTGVEMRFEEEREKLGTEVESRVQKAEANRMLLLKAYRQRRATLKERSAQSLLRRIAREIKYKERVRDAIQQKRAAAESKRLGLLEAEKKKAHARVLQVRRVAKSVYSQREADRRRMKDQLEDRLQRAKKQRAEYLRQRGRLQNAVHLNLNKMRKQGDLLSRKLARCWRRFLKQRKTTIFLAKAFDSLAINEMSVKSMPFEQLARLIESTATIQTVKALLDRLESRFIVARNFSTADTSSSLVNIDHLLKRVATPNRRTAPKSRTRKSEAKSPGSVNQIAKVPQKLPRYQVRVVLCAYMILGHPDAVFSGQGDRVTALAKAAEYFIREFELLMKIILEGPLQCSDEESNANFTRRCTFRSQLAAFDAAWCSYLNSFVVWKVKDARLLEDDLVRAACQLELSMIQTCKMTSEGETGALTHDMKAIQTQVTEDQKLLREKVQHLSGDAGIERMDSALSNTRAKYFQEKGEGSPLSSPVTHLSAKSLPNSPAVSSVSGIDVRNNVIESSERPSRVVRSLFRDDAKEVIPSASGSSSKSQLGSMITENELIVNEVLHEKRLFLADNIDISENDANNIKATIQKTMEKAFWDSIIESVEQDEPRYERVIELMREARDEICEMAPESWKQEIMEAIDLDILSELLRSGNLDIDYLGKILQFALVMLQKLSAPANEDEMQKTCQKLMKELAEICEARENSKKAHAIAMIKGLRFLLEQIQVLKREISRARIRLMEPLLKSHAGFDYLQNAFAGRHGSPSDSTSSLPLTLQWLSSISDGIDHEWDEHRSSVVNMGPSFGSSTHGLLPSTTLRSGGSTVVKTNGSSISGPTDTTGEPQPECNGEKVDLLLRLGLLKLVSGVSGLTKEVIPETLELNLSRLRTVQAEIQKIIVISTSILVLRQTLVSERLVSTPGDLENTISKCVEQLFKLLDNDQDAVIKEIIETMSKLLEDGDKSTSDGSKLLSGKEVMGRMLAKSLQTGDAVFLRVSHAVYLAARGVMLGGTGLKGRKLATIALRQVGAVLLVDRLVKAAEVLIVVATVSGSVHGSWYKFLIENMRLTG
ncbi:T-complex 11 [Dillenia turbinata]|uniref:T-complex 11 n=1 Tax=Dillenia turbinata TaxID=194707 RepID=A0AAN8W5D5_9MAGN